MNGECYHSGLPVLHEKQVLAFLRRIWKILVSAFLDDILVQAPTYGLCCLHMQLTALVLLACCYALNYEKSSILPSQELTHLGFIWNTKSMTISVPQVLLRQRLHYTF